VTPWRDSPFLILAAAAALAAVAASNPGFASSRTVRDLYVVIDITQSMNVRDMGLRDTIGESRLEAARAEVVALMARQPCGVRMGLGVFTERRSLTLIEPVEICAAFGPLSEAVSGLDWRMAWEGDSMIARGLHHALDRAVALEAGLVFLTDGHEAPPPPYGGAPAYAGSGVGRGGLVVGVGGFDPAPIPRFDDFGREVGFWGPRDVQHAPSRIGPPPPDAASRPGFHPRNNPYGESDLDGAEHLSALRLEHLGALAEPLGLGVVPLTAGSQALDAALAASISARPARGHVATGHWFAAAALLAAAAVHLVALRDDLTLKRRMR
jgi:mxaL protein